MPFTVDYDDAPDSNIVVVMTPEVAVLVYTLLSCGIDMYSALWADKIGMPPRMTVAEAQQNLGAVAHEFINNDGGRVLDSLKAQIELVTGGTE